MRSNSRLRLFSSPLAISAFAIAAMAPSAYAQTQTTISAVSRGSYGDTGDAANNTGTAFANYLVGKYASGSDNFFRNFFIFNVPALSAGQSYTAATFSFNSANFVSPKGTETLSLRSIDNTTYASLVDGTGGVAAYTDLGDGTDYGSGAVTASRTIFTITFSSAALSAINQSAGGPFGFGGFDSTIDAQGGNEFIDGTSFSASYMTRLNLTASATGDAVAPEPGSIALLALGLTSGLPVVGLIARRKRRQA